MAEIQSLKKRIFIDFKPGLGNDQNLFDSESSSESLTLRLASSPRPSQ